MFERFYLNKVFFLKFGFVQDIFLRIFLLLICDLLLDNHEFFLLGHVANSIGYSPEKVAEVIQKKGISSSKSSGWFSWLFG